MSARAVVLAALALAACSSRPSAEIFPGRYSGSTSADVGVTVVISGTEVEIDGKEGKFVRVDDNRRFVGHRSQGFPTWSCQPLLESTELRCEVRSKDDTETIEMMRE